MQFKWSEKRLDVRTSSRLFIQASVKSLPLHFFLASHGSFWSEGVPTGCSTSPLRVKGWHHGGHPSRKSHSSSINNCIHDKEPKTTERLFTNILQGAATVLKGAELWSRNRLGGNAVREQTTAWIYSSISDFGSQKVVNSQKKIISLTT